MEISDFVARAEGAEKKLAALTARCVELESAVATMDATRSGSSSTAGVASSSSDSLVASSSSKAALLASLAQLREIILTDTKERQELKKENETLKTQLRKSEYRVNHLVRMLEEEEKKNEAK